MLRYKTETRTGLVALYDIRPGNGAGQFLQPRSLHRASSTRSLPSCAGCSESKCNQRLCVRLLTYAHYAPYGGHNASMAVVSLSVCLSVCLFVCLFVRLSVCPMPDPGLRMEEHSQLNLAGRKAMTRVTCDPIQSSEGQTVAGSGEFCRCI